ncbi:hypothetical protein [Nocardia aurantiaca]|uniref:DUF4351 domain-containing protein n=1 Tax=Nocardia aurantiaca TaxID=2675850 RepID=A0A6I3KUM4_9NOCA|nr:hypothetical protein [Nocardia aurantiaca]MTE11189.1 hypothetical protein [Nocardia aurantiaca]
MTVDLSFFRSETSQRLRAEGRVEGRVQTLIDAILRSLRARGIEVSQEARQRIESCRELDTLDAWFDRSLTASSITEIFDKEG